MDGATALVKTLEDLQIKHIFGYPGGANLPLYDALRNSKIQHILARHEQGAALMADGYGRVSGKPGVCLATSGPGVTNLVTGLANALLDSSPVLALTGQIPTRFVGTDAFQEVDCFNITMPVTKHNEIVVNPNEIVPATRSAYHIANTGRQGPVLVDYPRDVLTTKQEYDLTADRQLPGYQPTEKGHVGQIKRALKLLKKAQRPLFLVGGGIRVGQAEAEFLRLFNALNIPAVRTLMGKGVLADDEPRFVGMIGTHGSIEGNKAISKADVILALGTRFGDRSTMQQKERFASKATIIHVDIDPAEIGKIVPTKVPIVGDLKTVLTDMYQEWQRKPFQAEEPWVKSKRRKSVLATHDNAFFLEDIFKQLSMVDQELTITTDVGRHQMWATHYCNNPKHLPLLTSGGLGTMGFGLPAAIGAWFARPECPVINISGDGSFLMNLQEFIVAVEHNIPLVILLVNDYRLGMIRELQDSAYGGRHTGHDFGRKTNYVKLAEAMGGVGITITHHKNMLPALQQALDSKRPTLLNFELEQLAQSTRLELAS